MRPAITSTLRRTYPSSTAGATSAKSVSTIERSTKSTSGFIVHSARWREPLGEHPIVHVGREPARHHHDEISVPAVHVFSARRDPERQAFDRSEHFPPAKCARIDLDAACLLPDLQRPLPRDQPAGA